MTNKKDFILNNIDENESNIGNLVSFNGVKNESLINSRHELISVDNIKSDKYRSSKRCI